MGPSRGFRARLTLVLRLMIYLPFWAVVLAVLIMAEIVVAIYDDRAARRISH